MEKEKKSVKAEETTSGVYSAIPREVMTLITKCVTEKAIAIYEDKEKERRRAMKDNRKKNTRLLLKKYRTLKKHAGNAISDLTQILSEEELVYLESMGLENLETRRVESIKERVIFTDTCLGHIDTMLAVYKNQCMTSGNEMLERRWRVIEAMYLANEYSSAEEIAENEHVEVRTVFRDVEAAITELSGLFFGIDLSDIFWF